MKQLYMSIKNLLYYIKFRLTILIYLQPIVIWIIFIVLFTIMRLYFYESFMLCDDKRSLVNPINTIIVGKEATYYGKEILNECHHALKGKNWTQVEAMSKIKETLYNMKNKDKWTVTENLKNLISLVIQFRAVQAMNEKDPDYKYLLLIQIAYYITVNGEKENVSTLLDTFHNLNINMNKGLHLGRLKIILASGIIATNTSLQNFINKTFKPTKIISSIQYFRYITYGRKTFNHEVLKEIADQYTNCTSYENQTSRVLTLMEAFQAPKFNAFLKANNVDDFEHHLINSKLLPPFFKRTMHQSSVYVRGLKNVVEHTLNQPTTTRSYTRTAVRLKKQAAKDLANDHTGKHPHVTENYCILKGCENQKCPSLCDQPNGSDIKGHNTHKPPVGRIARFVDSQDANGNAESQYFVKTNKKVTVSETEKQQYGKEIKDDPKQTTYVQNHDDKYDN